MLDERDEFLLSRYTDGDLTPDERARVETLLAASPEARESLRHYRQLNGLLSLARETPDLDFDALRDGILEQLDAPSDDAPSDDADAVRPHEQRRLLSPRADDAAAVAPSLGFNRLIAMAACVLLAAGLSWQLYRISPALPIPGSPMAVQTSQDPTDLIALTPAPGPTGAGVLIVSASRPESSNLPPVTAITIGPSPAVANLTPRDLYAPDRRTPPKVAIEPLTQPAASDPRSPF